MVIENIGHKAQNEDKQNEKQHRKLIKRIPNKNRE
jgi:hypothetical protein